MSLWQNKQPNFLNSSQGFLWAKKHTRPYETAIAWGYRSQMQTLAEANGTASRAELWLLTAGY